MKGWPTNSALAGTHTVRTVGTAYYTVLFKNTVALCKIMSKNTVTLGKINLIVICIMQYSTKVSKDMQYEY